MARLGRAQPFAPFQFGAIAASALNDLVASGTLSISGTADLDATGALLAAGVLSITGAADLDTTGSLVAAGALSITGAADLDAIGSLLSAGSLSISGAADLDALGSLVAAGALSITGAADLSGLSANDISAAGSLSITGAAALTALGQLLATGSLDIAGSASLAGAPAQIAGGHYWPSARKKRRDPLEDRIEEQRQEALRLREAIERAIRGTEDDVGASADDVRESRAVLVQLPSDARVHDTQSPTAKASGVAVQRISVAPQLRELESDLARTERAIARYTDLDARRQARANELEVTISASVESLLHAIEDELAREAKRLAKITRH